MALRKQPRSIARELALLSISQIKTKKNQLSTEDLNDLILVAIRTLIVEVQDNLETASAEIKRGEERILNSETRASDLNSAKAMLQEAVELSQTAVNRLGMAIEFPEFLQLTNKEQVREYAAKIILTVNNYHREIEKCLENVLVAWQLSRLPQVDRDILRIAVAEIIYLDVPEKVAINESVELAKRYSDEDGFRFINGVLRRLSDRIKEQGVEAITTEQEKVTQVEENEAEETVTLETKQEEKKKSTPILKQTFTDRD
ncbi:MAG: transcription antitermination factor NusB [Pleurocapsa sp. MO_226.B13]|nr:transcription antitermination factor NusB [Pleurocapsa sp. MO_226.B13]